MKIFLFEEDISFFLILSSIPVLMIASWEGKWDDDFLDSEEIDFCKRRSTSTGNRDISILQEECDIFLCEPLYSLDILHLIKGFFHVSIELPESDDPLILFTLIELCDDRFKYVFCSLTSAYHEYVFFISFP